MKKILAMALSIMLVIAAVPALLSLDASACAPDPYGGGSDPTKVGPPNYGYSVCMDDYADVVNGNYILDFGARVLGTDTITIEIPLIWREFLYWDTVTQSYVNAGQLADSGRTDVGPWILDSTFIQNCVELEFSDSDTEAIFGRVEKWPYRDGQEAHFRLTAQAIGLASGTVRIQFRHFDNREINYSASVPINGRVIDPTINKDIVGIVDRPISYLPTKLNGFTPEYNDPNLLSGAMDENTGVRTINTELDLGIILPGDYISFYLNTDSFTWDPLINSMASMVRKSTLDNCKISVTTKIAEGKKLVDKAEIENHDGRAYVVVRFIDDFASVDEKDFDMKIYLSYRGKKNENTMVRITGTLANDEMNVDDADYAFLGDGTVAVVDMFTRGIELDLDCGVSVFRNLTPDKKYYGFATDEKTDADYEIMEYYPTIRKVVNLTTRNIKTYGNIVKLTLEEEDLQVADGTIPPDRVVYFIYDDEGKYLGTTDDMLPYRDKYYYSSQIITVDSDFIASADGDWDEEALSDSLEEDGEELGNLHDNPSTGANGGRWLFLGGIALILAGLLTAFPHRRLGLGKAGSCLLLALLLTVSAASPAFALATYSGKNTVVAEIVDSPFHPAYEGNAANDPEITTPGDEIIIPIVKQGCFTDADGVDVVWAEPDPDPTLAPVGPSVAQLKSNNIKPYLMVAAGKDLIRDYEFVSYKTTPSVRAQAALRIRFVEDVVSTEELTYRFTIYLVHRGKMFDTQETYGGMISNSIIDVYNKDYVNLEHGDVGKAYITSDNVNVYTGNGVYHNTDMVYGEKYYGVTKLEPNEGQSFILRQYPQIEETYLLKTVNMRTHGNPITFDKFEGDPRFVYNLKGEFVGTTDDALPYSTRYYLSKEFIEINTDDPRLIEDNAPQYPDPFYSAAVEKFAAGLTEQVTEAPED